MIGEIGVAVGDLTPQGRILVHGEYWNAVATAPLKEGDRVRVTAIDHLNLTVEPLQNQLRG
jgi:membrane-bound serine protease (ClpP class)